MSRPPLTHHARTPTPPTTASLSLLLRPRARLLLVNGSYRAAAAAAAAATPRAAAAASTDLTCSHYASVSSCASSSSTSRARGCSGLVALSVSASAVAVSVCLVFFSAIRSMLAWKRDAEFLENYFDSARANLPETMASVRLVGREIGDLAADLSDLSQELTKGVRSSMRIVHAAEAQLKATTRPGSPLRMSNQNNRLDEPLLASTVRDLRELIADIRSGFGTASGMTRAIMWALNLVSNGRKNR